MRRLNRVEYRNTIRDLIGVNYDTAAEFPADDTGHGFDNIADVLTISPMLLEKYLDAAQAIIDEAVPVRSRQVAERRLAGAKFISTVAVETVAVAKTESESSEESNQSEALVAVESPKPAAAIWQAGRVRGSDLDLV